jgi:hypothetical protein
MNNLDLDQISFIGHSVADDVGQIFFYEDKVFRTINSDKFATFYSDLLQQEWISEVFQSGLVGTKICQDISIEGIPLILEHDLISFDSNPGEWTSQMFWLAAKKMIEINIQLSRHGYLLKDSHSWNIAYYRGCPIFIDFASVTKADKIPGSWLAEFIVFFAVPIFLSKLGLFKLSQEYRKECVSGFGMELFSNRWISRSIFFTLHSLKRYTDKPTLFFEAIEKWIDNNVSMSSPKEYWSNYTQNSSIENIDPHGLFKEKFVYEILNREKPHKVLDCAANQGFFAEMSANLGASVVAFDYEEWCIDECLKLAQTKNLDITPVVMNFKSPTANCEIGLAKADAFSRFQVDIVLALGLIHHLCIVQNMPVELFCRCCMQYARKGIILEYVDPLDKHVSGWNKSIPKNYSLKDIQHLFSKKFPKFEFLEYEADGIVRSLLYFST